jgi:hypothetical protein
MTTTKQSSQSVFHTFKETTTFTMKVAVKKRRNAGSIQLAAKDP